MPCKNNIFLYQKIAAQKGGECLSTEYLNASSKLKFKCKHGHVWETKGVNISGKGRWCPHCAPNKKLSLADAIDFANQFDGYCISKTYVKCTDKLQWKCKYGHEWESTFVSIKNSKGWCPQCTGKLFSENLVRLMFERLTGKKFIKIKPKWLKYGKSFLELDGYCSELGLAFEHQGAQHYKLTGFSSTKKILNKIKHRDEIKQKLCNANNITLIMVPDVFSIIGIDNLFDFIQNKLKRNNVPINEINFHLEFFLKEIKTKPYDNIMSEINDLVKLRGGKCLSSYTHYNVKLKFQCNNGHEWLAKWNNIKFGSWCPFCYKTKPRGKYKVNNGKKTVNSSPVL